MKSKLHYIPSKREKLEPKYKLATMFRLSPTKKKKEKEKE
jgi:hypothetical protein